MRHLLFFFLFSLASACYALGVKYTAFLSSGGESQHLLFQSLGFEEAIKTNPFGVFWPLAFLVGLIAFSKLKNFYTLFSWGLFGLTFFSLFFLKEAFWGISFVFLAAALPIAWNALMHQKGRLGWGYVAIFVLMNLLPLALTRLIAIPPQILYISGGVLNLCAWFVLQEKANLQKELKFFNSKKWIGAFFELSLSLTFLAQSMRRQFLDPLIGSFHIAHQEILGEKGKAFYFLSYLDTQRAWVFLATVVAVLSFLIYVVRQKQKRSTILIAFTLFSLGAQIVLWGFLFQLKSFSKIVLLGEGIYAALLVLALFIPAYIAWKAYRIEKSLEALMWLALLPLCTVLYDLYYLLETRYIGGVKAALTEYVILWAIAFFMTNRLLKFSRKEA